jgi:hypothetical protein
MVFRVELDQSEWQQLLNIVGKQPFVDVAQLIGKISQQLQQAQQPQGIAGNGEIRPANPPARGAES